MRLKKGDMVTVIAGKEKGKSGKIMKVLGEQHKVVVEKLNIVKKHQRPSAKSKGGIVEKEGKIDVSNVMYLCSKCGKGVRIGYRILADGKKVRVCRSCHEVLDA